MIAGQYDELGSVDPDGRVYDVESLGNWAHGSQYQGGPERRRERPRSSCQAAWPKE